MKLRNVFAVITAAAMTLSLAACSGQSTASSTSSASSDSSSSAASESSVSSEKSTASEESSGASYTIGICNYVDDASLNQIVENINARLAEIESGQGITINVKYDNCNADANVMNQIIANFAADNVDLMVGVATPVAMAMQSATEDSKTPVVFAAVSDPVGAGLVASLEEPGSNMTGSSDNLDTNSVMNLIFAQNPDAKKIGLLYDVGQDSSTAAIEHAKAYLDDKGVEYVERTATTAEEVALAAQALVSDGVDAVFTPTDNTIMKAELAIYETFADAGIPHYTGADSFALNGAFLGYGVDYANLGRETADMIASILTEGKDPATTPVITFDNGTATVNTEICEKLGFDFDTVSEAFAPYCTRVEEITTAESFSDLES
ncbi:ABC transporter substrate-binding protein [Neglectibacter sp. CSJ-5]|uniref:ABC transporter substrate-binding protein n=1 Tax=Neglectibacter sp. CSJ-5 TaxID=3078043 RepID=UPI00292FCAEA|nr:ABC transporter substrate-binding protein [Neglectibacter sp. CSJ-5]